MCCRLGCPLLPPLAVCISIPSPFSSPRTNTPTTSVAMGPVCRAGAVAVAVIVAAAVEPALALQKPGRHLGAAPERLCAAATITPTAVLVSGAITAGVAAAAAANRSPPPLPSPPRGSRRRTGRGAVPRGRDCVWVRRGGCCHAAGSAATAAHP